MLKTRILTAAILVAALLGALFGLPAAGWAAFAGLILLVAAAEWGGFAGSGKAARWGYAVVTAVAGFAIALWDGLLQGAAGTLLLVPVYGLALAFWAIAAPLWLRRLPARPAPTLVLAIGWVVLLPTFLALVQLRNIHPVSLLLFMIIVWIADIAAYFTGRAFGRRKLAPRVSPGKTWEGCAGAMVATLVYAIVWSAIAPGHMPAAVRDLPGSPVIMLGLVAILTVLSVIGDLFESAMKRQAGLKDSGRILPGHGGVLDRIDALTPVLPVAALVMML